MSIDQRLSRLAPALTAQERAILILEAWKAGRPEDPAWRHTMPSEQLKAFNRYIELMNQANRVLGHLITALYHQARELELREAWLIDLTLWLEHIDDIGRAVRLSVKEPITESEYNAAVEAARDEWVPVEDLAAFLAGQRDDYSEDDYEEEEEDGWGLVLRDEVWDKAVAEEEKRLRALAAAGKVASRGKGKALKLQHRALQHFGHDVGAVSEDYLTYRVVPDNQAEEVEAERKALQGLQKVLDSKQYLGQDDDEQPSLPERIRQALRETTAYLLISIWVQLRCVEALVNEIGEAFNGIDPLKPAFREKLDGTREKLQAIREHLSFLRMECELREPLEEELTEMRGWLEELPAST